MWIYDPLGLYTDDYYYYYYTYGGQAAAVAGFFLAASLIFFLLCFCCLFEERPETASTYTYVYPRPTVLQVNVPPDVRPIERVILVQQGKKQDRSDVQQMMREETNMPQAKTYQSMSQNDQGHSPDSHETISLSISSSDNDDRPISKK